MDFNNVFIKEVPLQEGFSYKALFNNSRGAVHKDDKESLIDWCIEDGIIEVKKYLLAENIDRDTVWDITDSKNKSIIILKDCLKGYTQENDFDLFPFVYLLGRINPDYKVNLNRSDSEQSVLEYPNNIEVGYKFSETNAFTRLFLVDEKVRAKNQKIHKYAGILKCFDCGKGFVARSRKTESKGTTITYVCSTFHKFGSQFCTGHRIMEEDIDEIVLQQMKMLLYSSTLRLDEIDKNIEDRLNKKKDYEKQSEQIRIRIHKKEEEIKGYSRQLAQGFINEKLFLELSGDANKELDKLEDQLNQLEKLSESSQYEKENIIKSIDILQEIIQKKSLTNTNISTLIDKIIIKETDEIGEYNRPKLDIEVVWNTPYLNVGGIEGLEKAV